MVLPPLHPIGQKSHKPALIQGMGIWVPPLDGRTGTEFVATPSYETFI